MTTPNGGLIPDSRALDLIAEAMSGQEWSADTLDEVAGIVRLAGREVRDLYDDAGLPDDLAEAVALLEGKAGRE